MTAKPPLLLACLAAATATCDRSDFGAREPAIAPLGADSLPDGVHADLVTLALAELVPAFEAEVGPPGLSPPYFIVEDAGYGFPPAPRPPPGFDGPFIIDETPLVFPPRKTHLVLPPHLDEALRKAGEWTRRHGFDLGHPERRRWRERVGPGQSYLVLADVRDCDDRGCAMEWYPGVVGRTSAMTGWWVKAVAVPGGWTLAEPVVPGITS